MFVTGIGIYLNNTRDVVLRRITINGTNQNYGIRGYGVTNFTLEYATIGAATPNSAVDVAANPQGTNTALPAPESAGEGAIYFGNSTAGQTGVTGTAMITNCKISGGRTDNMRVLNSGGSLNRLVITGTLFGLTSAALPQSNAALTVVANRPVSGTTTLNSTVTGCTFYGSPGNAANFTGQEPTTALGVATDIIFQNNTITNSHANNNIGGCNLTIAGFSNTTFNASNNTMSGANGSAITLQLGAPIGGSTVATSLSGTINNNQIGVAATPGSGSASGNGIFFSFADNATGPKGQVVLAVTNNQIRSYNGNGGIYADNTGGSYDCNFTITGNTTTNPGSNAFGGLILGAGAPLSADDIDVCATITGNDFSGGAPAGGFDIFTAVSSGSSSIRLPGYVGATLTDVQNFLRNNNLNSASTSVSSIADAPATAANYIGGAACTLP
jgi:hypothetical protein